MRRLAIDIDCNEFSCGQCKKIEDGICSLFGELSYEPQHEQDYLRKIECIDLEIIIIETIKDEA